MKIPDLHKRRVRTGERNRLPPTVNRYGTIHRYPVPAYCPELLLIKFHNFPGSIIAAPWALNNYWDTNFCANQQGAVTLAYEMNVHGMFDERVFWEDGVHAARPVVAGALSSPQGVIMDAPPTGKLCTQSVTSSGSSRRFFASTQIPSCPGAG